MTKSVREKKRSTFEVERDHKLVIGGRDGHPSTFRAPHGGAGEGSIHKVVESVAFPNRLLA